MGVLSFIGALSIIGLFISVVGLVQIAINIMQWHIGEILVSIFVCLLAGFISIGAAVRHGTIVLSEREIELQLFGLTIRKIKLDENARIASEKGLDEFGKLLEVLRISGCGGRITVPAYINNFDELKRQLQSRLNHD